MNKQKKKKKTGGGEKEMIICEWKIVILFVFFFFFFVCVTGSLYVSLFSGRGRIVIRYEHIAGCQSLYSYILSPAATFTCIIITDGL